MVKSSILLELEANCTKLLQALLLVEQEYLLLNYQPKEHQFSRVYTRSYPNLGANSTQQSESYHNMIKGLINQQMPLAESVRRIKDHIKEIGKAYYEDINKQQTKVPPLLDLDGALLGQTMGYELFFESGLCISKSTWYGSAKIYSNNRFFSRNVIAKL